METQETSVMNRENIKSFVQQVLGCGCPEEVFGHIECTSNIKINDIVLRSRINIGNRLLIYIRDADDVDALTSVLPVLINAGRKERDSLGFNRLRIVLAAKDIDAIKKAACNIFESINKDEKIHLHIIQKDKIPV